MLLKSTENTADIAGRLGCLECLGRLSRMPWESSGISEIARVTNVRFPSPDSWTDDLTGRSVGWIHLLYILGTTIRSDGDYPSEGIPLCLDSYYTLWDGRWSHQRFRNYLTVYCTPH